MNTKVLIFVFAALAVSFVMAQDDASVQRVKRAPGFYAGFGPSYGHGYHGYGHGGAYYGHGRQYAHGYGHPGYYGRGYYGGPSGFSVHL